MRVLSDNQVATEGFLSVLGPGNWGGPSPRSPLTSTDEGLLTHYLSELRVETPRNPSLMPPRAQTMY